MLLRPGLTVKSSHTAPVPFTDTVNTIASVGMTAADYANFAVNSLVFD
ncbi:hypothetical protein J7481_12835 [Labrenzia sp. R4_2]|nr:hypothetical protein [Labrenzia sp. R4_2]MBO9420381.1 hypothetical protein [Labrenzia sp. R4_2]